MKQFEEQTKEEQYYDAISTTLSDIRTNIQDDKDKDLVKFKDQIKELLEEEIVSRYFYQRGEIESSFDDDPMLKKAIELLKDTAAYSSILTNP